MPVRLTDIPGLRSTQLNMPGINLKAALAPAAALGDVAEGISSVSTAFSKIGHALQKQEDTKGELETKGVVDKVVRTAAEENKNDPNPANHVARARKANADVDKAVNSPHLSPAARAKSQVYAAEQKDQNLIAAGGSAANQQIQQKTAALDARMKTAFESGNESVFRDTLRIGQESGDYDAERTLRLRQGFRERVTDIVVRNEIHNDPGGWIERNKNPNRDAPGFDPVKHTNWTREARQLQTEKTVNVYNDSIQDIEAGIITRPEQVDERATGLHQSVGIKLKERLKQKEQLGLDAKRRSPEEQNRLVGEVSNKLRSYDADDDNYDNGLIEIMDGIRQIEEGPTKKMLEADLANIRTGKRERARTNADLYAKEIDLAWDNYGFGRERTPVMTADVAPLLKDGLLKDPAKLKLTTMSDEDIAYVTDKWEDNPGPGGGRILMKDETRMARFREKYNALKDRKPLDDHFLQSAFDSIAAGKTVVEYSDPKKVAESALRNKDAETRFGEAKTKFAVWREANPKASREEMKAEVWRLCTTQPKSKASDSVLPPPPGKADFPMMLD